MPLSPVLVVRSLRCRGDAGEDAAVTYFPDRSINPRDEPAHPLLVLGIFGKLLP